jgi:hypothetical protein
MAVVGFNHVTDLYSINNVTENTLIRVPKDSIISTLKNYFSKDSKYHFVADQWGYPLVIDLTNVPSEAGLHDDVTTRIFIGDKNRLNNIFFPAIIVSTGSYKYVPLSLNRDHHTIEYELTKYVDGYGNSQIIRTPVAFTPGGIWEGTITIDIFSRGLRERDDLVELVAILFTDLAVDTLYRSGIIIKPTLTIGSSGDTEDRNDKLYKQSINLDVRGEWERKIPINNIVNVISICADIGNLETTPEQLDPNLEINARLTLLDAFQ